MEISNIDENELNINYTKDFYNELLKFYPLDECDKITDITLRSYGFDIIYELNDETKKYQIYWEDLAEQNEMEIWKDCFSSGEPRD